MATTAAPAPGPVEDAELVPAGYNVLREGKAAILQHGNDVFYNEAQVTNRDLSILVLRRFLPLLAEECTSGALRKNRRQGGHKQQSGASRKEQGHSDVATTSTSPAATTGAAGSDNQPPQQYQGAVVLEGLAASGLRSIRYVKEVPGIARVDANDMDRAVSDSMQRNVNFNGPDVAAKIRVMCSDARLTMLQSPLGYDVVDLDPYGTPAQLLDSAVQSVADGGLLQVTATDMANLCGNNSVACWANYNCYPLHRPYCHEQALRILLASVEAAANRYKRHIVPLLSLSVDFYIRLFLRIYTSPAVVKDSACKLAYVWQSSGCDSFWLQPVGQKKQNGNSTKYMPGYGPACPDMKCPDSGSGYIMGGPIWAGPLHDPAFVSGLQQDLAADHDRYAQHGKIKGYLVSVAEELNDVPLYYDLHDICKTVRCQPPKSEVFRSALLNAGYRASGSHANPLAVKTDAPPSVVWDILRCWIKDHPVTIKDPNSYAAKILAKEPTLVASFAKAKGAARPNDTPRFVQNPAYWGPKSKHGRPPVQKPGVDGAAPSTTAAAQRDAAGQPDGKSEQQLGAEQGAAPAAQVAEQGAQNLGADAQSMQAAGEAGGEGQGSPVEQSDSKRQRVD